MNTPLTNRNPKYPLYKMKATSVPKPTWNVAAISDQRSRFRIAMKKVLSYVIRLT